MEKTGLNYEDYWKEVEELHKETKTPDADLEEDSQKQEVKEGEKEATWLKDVGFDHLCESFQQGREIPESDLNASISCLSKQQAEAVKKRVRSLNQTIRNGYRQQRSRSRKPHIRDVFRDMENSSTGSRSRSATPDSLDDVIEIEDDWNNHYPNATKPPAIRRESLRRTPSAPVPKVQVRSNHDMFRKSGPWPMGNVRLDVASNTEGIELLGYQRTGTIHGPKGRMERTRSGSDPAVKLSALDMLNLENVVDARLRCNITSRNEVSRSHNSLFDSAVDADRQVSFENFCQESEPISYVSDHQDADLMDIDSVSDADYSQLMPLLWLEVSAIFDGHSIEFQNKPYKRKHKENGNVFGVSLSSLVMRDRRICSDNSTVPQVFQIILEELQTRCCKEEGILRVAGQKQRVEVLCSELEANFYTKPDEIRSLLQKSLCHELVAVLKKLLRDLPQPLLTTKLIHLFYQTHALPNVEIQYKVLNLLVLLLPVEHSGTLRSLISFLETCIKNEQYNKMSLHNVAMIIAPSLFPPKYVQPLEKNDLSGQVKTAAVCCRLVELILQFGLDLWKVPIQLWHQLQQKIQNQALQKLNKIRKKKELLQRSNTQYDASSRGFSGYPATGTRLS